MFGIPSLAALRRCVDAGWSPQIGDPGLGGWLTVLSYLVCCALAIVVLRRRPRDAMPTLWAIIAGVTGFLAINKQLDLQTALTATGRCLARMQGWYDYRYLVQIIFILTLIAVVFVALIEGFRLLAGYLRSNGLAMLGLACVSGFVLVRAVGFHHVDALINVSFASIRFNFLFENIGLVMIAVNAILLLRRGSKKKPRPARVRPSRP